jgi:hypothetical protein
MELGPALPHTCIPQLKFAFLNGLLRMAVEETPTPRRKTIIQLPDSAISFGAAALSAAWPMRRLYSLAKRSASSQKRLDPSKSDAHGQAATYVYVAAHAVRDGENDKLRLGFMSIGG